MSRPRSWLADFAVYLVVRLLVCLLQALPWQTGYAFAGFLAWLAYRVDRRHREAARENLSHAFPGRYTDAEREQVVRSVYLHYCKLIVELVQMPRKMHVSNWKNYFGLGDDPRVVGYLTNGRPLLIVTGHFGNWELAGYALGLVGFSTYAIARPLDNPFLDQYLQRFRESTGQKILAKHGDFEQIQSVLAEGGALATLGDQDAGPRGLFVDFFGRPASTHKAIALLALQYQVPMVVVGVAKVGDPMCYRLVTEDLIRPEEYEGRPDAVRAITQRFTTALERIVRRYPEQYFWLHRRWKHQPKARGVRKAA